MNSKDRFGNILKIILIVISVIAIVGFYYDIKNFLTESTYEKIRSEFGFVKCPL